MNTAFAGETYEPELDFERLTSQLAMVKAVMMDGRKRTLREIAERAGGSEAGVSARLRDLRKPQNGSWAVFKARRNDPHMGIWEYWCKP